MILHLSISQNECFQGLRIGEPSSFFMTRSMAPLQPFPIVSITVSKR